MPEAPPQANTFVTADDNLSTHPAYGKIQQRHVAWLASEASRAAKNVRRTAAKMLAESASEEVLAGLLVEGQFGDGFLGLEY